MRQKRADLRWGTERRLEFIEFRLYWEGRINRSDIIKYFGVSVPQASKDISLYQAIAPKNMDYDKSEKRYFSTTTFKPKFLKPDPDRYLSQLRLISEKITPASETWLVNLPGLDCMPMPHRRVKSEVLRELLAGIRDRRAMEIHYQSMNPKRPDPIWRGISPHALASDGFRWHVRAFCHIEQKFKDFLVSRCIECEIRGDAHAASSDDSLWQEFFDVHLRPNPDLSESQRRIVSEDYEMQGDELILPVRKSLLYYFQRRMRLDVAAALDNPNEAPVVIANYENFQLELKKAMS